MKRVTVTIATDKIAAGHAVELVVAGKTVARDVAHKTAPGEALEAGMAAGPQSLGTTAASPTPLVLRSGLHVYGTISLSTRVIDRETGTASALSSTLTAFVDSKPAPPRDVRASATDGKGRLSVSFRKGVVIG
jgi:antitoxin (DNA-binding transcriptional repressor) of toxin-antitoxin stability system